MKKIALVLMTFALEVLMQIDCIAQPIAQPPSLQMGLNALTFRPGTLDAELILQIIAEKQEEIKKRAIKNLILRQVNQAGGTVYIFADNVLNALITEKDNSIRTRNILENTVNLVFAMALTEYVRNQQSLKKLTQLDSFFSKSNNTVIVSKEDFTGSFKHPVDTSNTRSRSFLYILDIVSETIRTNKQLNSLGLMRITYPGEWQSLNNYLNDPDPARKAAADILKSHSEGMLDTLLFNTGFIANQLQAGSFSFPAITELSLVKNIDNFNHTEFVSTLDQAIQEVEKLLTTNDSESGKLFKEKNGSALSEYWVYLKKIKNDLSKTPTLHQLSDILFHLNADVIPKFEQLNEFVPGVSSLFSHTENLRKIILTGAKFHSTQTNQISLMRLVAKLYQFKKAKTYSDYLNIMTDLPQLIGDSKVRSTLNTLLTFIRNYVKIKQDADNQELVEIDVESLLIMLQQYSQQRPRTVQFMFTVGANTAYRSAAIPDTVRNLAYIGEKLGLKIRLKNWHYIRSFNKFQTFYRHSGSNRIFTRLQPPQEPLISNMHLLIYGSGILYNLVKSSNNINFRQPLLGLGIGVTFINSLDLNLSFNFPQKSSNTFSENFSHPFINLGFDILFTEYLDRLFKKRNSIKIEK